MSETGAFRQQCQRLRLRETLVHDHWSLLSTVLTFLFVAAAVAAIVFEPVVRYVFLFFLLCYPMSVLPTHLLVRKLIADSQFRSSVNFGIRFLLSIVYTIVISIVIACCGGMWMKNIADLGAWWGLVAVAVAHFGALVTGPLSNGLKAILSNVRYWWLRLVKGKKMKALGDQYKRLADLF